MFLSDFSKSIHPFFGKIVFNLIYCPPIHEKLGEWIEEICPVSRNGDDVQVDVDAAMYFLFILESFCTTKVGNNVVWQSVNVSHQNKKFPLFPRERKGFRKPDRQITAQYNYEDPTTEIIIISAAITIHRSLSTTAIKSNKKVNQPWREIKRVEGRRVAEMAQKIKTTPQSNSMLLYFHILL